MKLDILAVAAHPDDIELACSGTLMHHLHLGKKVGILDLTQGELGTRGNASIRLKEAQNAAEILGISLRDNLGLDDGFFQNDKSHQLEIIKKIRQYQPEIVLCNALTDRHPDHGRAAELVSNACFYSGLVKIETIADGLIQNPWRPKTVYHYIQDYHQKPDFVLDISDFMDQKMDSIKAFKSQFYDPQSTEPNSPISSKEFLDFVIARAAEFGRQIGVKYAEGFTSKRYLGIKNLFDLI
jgi:bacillithiol biosynthesis deacetylase BshB1